MHIICPKCGFDRDIPDDKIPPKAARATCPKCGHKFSFRDVAPPPVPHEHTEDDDAIFQELESDMETGPEPDAGVPEYASTGEEPAGIPWERLDRFGFFHGLYLTLFQAIFHPIRFFRSMSFGTGIGKPLIFYLIVSEIQALSQFFWQMIGVTSIVQNGEQAAAVGLGSSLILVVYPFFATIGLFLFTGLLHLFLILLKGTSRGYEGTFKAFSYGSSPIVFSIIPLLGQFLGGLWSLLVIVIGFKEVHRTTYLKAIVPMLLLVLLFVLLFTWLFYTAFQTL